MKPGEVLKAKDHRPWDLPNRKWSFYQQWENVFFLHWKIDPSLLQPFIPQGLKLDLHNNQAWVSFVGFGLKNARPRLLPALPLVSHFTELNLRTYVRHKDKAGVHFLSVECSNTLATALAKGITEVPYTRSKIRANPGSFQSNKNEKSQFFDLKYVPGELISSPEELDLWLTERYALHQGFSTKDKLISYDIHHHPWPLQKIHIQSLNLHYPAFMALVNKQPTLAHFSEGVTTLAWSKIKQNL